jgi:hypothetical protein
MPLIHMSIQNDMALNLSSFNSYQGFARSLEGSFFLLLSLLKASSPHCATKKPSQLRWEGLVPEIGIESALPCDNQILNLVK